MQIRWNNIITFGLVIVVIVLISKLLPAMTTTFATMKDIGPGHTTDEKTIGLLALGFLCVLIVAIVRILTIHNSK